MSCLPYKVGISSGWWGIAKAPELLGIPMKIGGFGATSGVQFNQIDLDTILEFLEPNLKKLTERMMKELNMEVGLHGEVREVVALESAERRYWIQSHDRFITTLKNSAELNFIYVNMHLSITIQLFQEEARIRPFGFQYQVVDYLGRPFHKLAEESPAVKNYIIRLLSRERSGMAGQISSEEIYKKKEEDYNRELDGEIREEAIRRIRARGLPDNPDIVDGEFAQIVREWRASGKLRERQTQFLYSVWKDSTYAQYILEAGEIDAYMCVAMYMIESGDPLWSNIVGAGYSGNPQTDAEKAYIEKQSEFCAAVSAKYLEGHLLTTEAGPNKDQMKGMSAKQWLEKSKLTLCLETPQTGEGTEGLNRFFHPLHAYHLLKKFNSEHIKFCLDFEQTMGQRIDVDKDFLDKAPNDFGKYTFLIHTGEPVPYFGTAHIPIMFGGRGQETIYGWLFKLRKKGFKNGYILFERGGGRGGGGKTMAEVFEWSVWALRQIVKYLDQDIPLDKLPPEFYGMSFENKETYALQKVVVTNHAWDPLFDVINIPEEKHTFLSKAAVDKGKREEWERRQFR